MQFSVMILGAGSATPAVNRYPSAQLLTFENECYLIDCGEGTQYRLLEHKIRPSRLRGVFISHLHGDHYFGLIGLLSSFNLGGRTEELFLIGPRGLDDIITMHFKYSHTPLHFPIQFTATDTELSYQVFENHYFTVTTIPLDHRIPCAGYLFKEKPLKRKLIKEKLSDDMPHEYLRKLKDGEDVIDEAGNVLYKCLDFTTPAPPPRSYAYCSDTRYLESIPEVIYGADLLYHEATFRDELAVQAFERYHSTATQAGIIAAKSNVKKLLIGHFSSRYKEFSGFLEDAQSVFPATEIAEEGKTFFIEHS
ncbi:ribonuclease Z [Runella sp.]|uniref:ribonuclease Z n=1 Tax=Runella sp. TaxID=1960881 RepID=UPI003D117CB3